MYWAAGKQGKMQDGSFKTTSCQTKKLPFLDVINSIPL